MKKLLVMFVAVAAQSAVADVYYVSIPSADMVDLVLTSGVPLPPQARTVDEHTWGIVRDSSPHLSVYLDAADDVVQMSNSKYAQVRKQCGGKITPSCVKHLIREDGHD